MRNSLAKFYVDKPIQWSEKLNILGFTIMADPHEMININYEKCFDKIQQVFDLWSLRSLTLMGRITVYNTLVVPIVIQKLTCLYTPPEWFYKKVHRKLMNFLWRGKRPQIAFKKLILRYQQGGLRLADL